jgi:AcrR family transcriptional regulator
MALGESDDETHALTEAKVARRSFHEHFAGKDGLVAAVPHRAADQLRLLIEGTLMMGATPDDRQPARAVRDLAAFVLG